MRHGIISPPDTHQLISDTELSWLKKQQILKKAFGILLLMIFSLNQEHRTLSISYLHLQAVLLVLRNREIVAVQFYTSDSSNIAAALTTFERTDSSRWQPPNQKGLLYHNTLAQFGGVQIEQNSLLYSAGGCRYLLRHPF